MVDEAGATRDAAGQIEALCGIVVTITLISAYTTRYDQMIGHTRQVLASANLSFLSLQMFFAITAYQLVKEISRHPDLLRYAIERMRRFLPAVIPAVALTYAIIAGSHIPRLHADIATLLANLTMVADFIGASDFDGAFWRIKIELMFSVVLGLVWFGMGPRAAAAVVALGLLGCAAQVQPDPVHQAVLSPVGLLTMDGYLPNFTFGMTLFFLIEGRNRPLWLCVGAVSACLVAASNTPLHAALVLFTYCVIVGAAHGRIRGLAAFKALTALGRIFLAVYLIHQAVGFALSYALEQRGFAPEIAIGAAAGAAILCGTGLHRIAAELRTANWGALLRVGKLPAGQTDRITIRGEQDNFSF